MMQMARVRLSLAASTYALHLPTTSGAGMAGSAKKTTRSMASSPDSATHSEEPPVSRVSLTETHEWRPEATHYAALADVPPIKKLNPIRRDRRCPRREVSFGVDEWALHKSVWRHWRHIFSEASSSTLQRLSFPALAVIGFSASSVTAYNTVVADAAAGVAELALPALPFTISSLVLGLLVCHHPNLIIPDLIIPDLIIYHHHHLHTLTTTTITITTITTTITTN